MLSDSSILGASPSGSDSLLCRRCIRLISRDPEAGCGYVCSWREHTPCCYCTCCTRQTVRGDFPALVWSCEDCYFVVSLEGLGFGYAIAARCFWADGSRRESSPLFFVLPCRRPDSILSWRWYRYHRADCNLPASTVLFPMLSSFRPLCVLQFARTPQRLHGGYEEFITFTKAQR